jgi:hypothetical protein
VVKGATAFVSFRSSDGNDFTMLAVERFFQGNGTWLCRKEERMSRSNPEIQPGEHPNFEELQIIEYVSENGISC